jgi:hypothetical protein
MNRLLFFSICIALLAAQALAQLSVHALPWTTVLVKDPADTNRLAPATMLEFDSDGTYHFIIHYAMQQDRQPPLRLIIYRPKSHPPETNCRTTLCWEEDVFSSSSEGNNRDFEKKIKKGSQVLVIAWQGGSSKSRGGDPVNPNCPPNAVCGVTLDSSAHQSRLHLTMEDGPQIATLDIERQDK